MFWILFFVNSVIFLYISRKIAYRLLLRLLKAKEISRRVAICGWGDNAKKIAGALSEEMTYYDFVGYFDESSNGQEKYLGTFSDIETVVKEKGIDEVIVALSHEDRNMVKKIIDRCFELHIDWKFVPDFFWAFSAETYLSQVENIPLLTIRKGDLEGLNLFLKIALDKVLSILFLFILSGLILIVSILVKLSSPGPILFKQTRVGRKGRVFKLYKFRSMKVSTGDKEHKKFMERRIKGMLTEKDKEGDIYKLKNENRVTSIGKIIRAYGIDEIPQFINVLKGDMSIVGPRPAIPYELEWYELWHKERLKVLPGITGLWQIKGRNGLEFEKGIKLDLKYITDWSFKLDFEIMFKTVWVLLFKKER
jgi:exopolysaccharide biosynthesis polyprenyl glycosylphosphotransferase